MSTNETNIEQWNSEHKGVVFRPRGPNITNDKLSIGLIH